MSHLPAALEIAPREVWGLLRDHDRARLVDVRTEPEWAYVGCPLLDSVNKSLIKLSWHVYPSMGVNDRFVPDLRRAADEEHVLMFICRSGGRSLAAAKVALTAGFRHCYSVAGGFEGDVGPAGHRGTVGGWKFALLPWKQT